MAERPPPLRAGGRIAVIAPSFPTAAWYPARFEAAVANLRAWSGCEIVVAAQATCATGFTAGDVRVRAAALNDALTDPSIDAVFFTIGGFNSAELLDHLDYATLERTRPKIVVGYSDCSSLLLALYARLGWVTYHGPAVMTQFGEYPHPFEYTLRKLDAALRARTEIAVDDPGFWTNEFVDWGSDEWNTRARIMRHDPGIAIWRAGRGAGTLFGGNLETINFLAGTAYWTPPERVVLFVEATEAEAYLPRVRRALFHLRLLGTFERVAALLIGRIPDAAPACGVDLRDTVLDVAADYDFPILAELPFGHVDPMITFPIGERCAVATDGSPVLFIHPDHEVAHGPHTNGGFHIGARAATSSS